MKSDSSRLRRAATILSVPVIVGAASAQDVVFRRVALTGDHAPGTTAGVVFEEFGTVPGFGDDFAPAVDADGNVAFHALLAGPGTNGHDFLDGNALGVWRSSGGTTTLLARQDEPAPGTPAGVVFMGFPTSFSTAAPLSAGGRALFAGGLRGPGIDGQYFTNAVGIWTHAQGNTGSSCASASRRRGCRPASRSAR